MPETETGGKVTIPGGLKINKKIAIGIGVAAVAIFVYMYYRQKQQANAQSTTADQSGQVDPQTGYPYGSAEDQAALAAMSGQTLPTYDSASSVGGQIIGYDQYGQPVYSQGYGGGAGGTPGYPVGPGSYSSNAQWGQAAEQSLGSTGADAIAAALGKYLTGSPVTPDQITVIQQAIAVQGYPPVGGPNGFPPSYKTVENPPPPQGQKVTVPNVVRQRVEEAEDRLNAAGLKSRTNIPRGNHPYIVTAQSPRAGAQVSKGSMVTLTVRIGT